MTRCLLTIFRTVYDVHCYEYKDIPYETKFTIENLCNSELRTIKTGPLASFKKTCFVFGLTISVILFPKHGVCCLVSDGNSVVTAPECRIGSGHNRVCVRVVTAQ